MGIEPTLSAWKAGLIIILYTSHPLYKGKKQDKEIKYALSYPISLLNVNTPQISSEGRIKTRR